jgi:hypothetical protein
MKGNNKKLALFVMIAAIAMFTVVAMASADGAQKFSAWSEPENLGPMVNSPYTEYGPAISKEGLSLYISSNRQGFGGFDIWVSQRASLDAPWGEPKNLGPDINTSVVLQ